MHACSRSSSGVAKKWVRTSFWGDFGFFWPRKMGKRRMFPRTQHWPLSKTPFVLCDVSPLRHTHRREKTSDRKQLDSGGWGCRMTRLFSHETGLLAPKHLKNFRCAGLRRGASHPVVTLRRTLAVTIIPVTFTSVAAAPGLLGRCCARKGGTLAGPSRLGRPSTRPQTPGSR